MTDTYIYPVYENDSCHSLNNRGCNGISTSKEDTLDSRAEHHCIPLDEFGGLTKEEAKERIKQELQIPFQTQGYTINYDIEVWLVNDWA